MASGGCFKIYIDQVSSNWESYVQTLYYIVEIKVLGLCNEFISSRCKVCPFVPALVYTEVGKFDKLDLTQTPLVRFSFSRFL